MNIYEQLKQQINQIILVKYKIELNQKQLSIEAPKSVEHGDLSTNAAMLLGKPLSKSPLLLAQELQLELEKLEIIEKVTVAAPGFINLTLKKSIWYKVLENIIKQGTNFADNNLGNGEKINIEFVSCNPTGPMHIGHSRGGVYGDALASLMSKCGYNVTREFYINDAGSQINTLAKSAYLRYLEASGEVIEEIPEGLYPGEYLIDIGKELFKQYGPNFKDMDKIKDFTLKAIMIMIKNDLALLGVHHDVFFSEKTLHEQNKIAKAVEELEKKGLVYRGILPLPKGKPQEDWEEREQLLLRSTEFGDDMDRPLQKSNGDWTYAAADIAYMQDKIERGFNKITIVLGADHLGYKKRMQAMAYALGGEKIDFEIKFCQLVNFLKDNQPFKMSKRSGNFLSVEDVLSEVNKDIVRFYMLTRRNDQVLDFDFENVKEQSKDNPVFYVQYANARIVSIIKNAIEKEPSIEKLLTDKQWDLTLLESEEDLQLIKLMASWPKIVELSCIHQEPHRIAFFLIDLAAEFHKFWSKGNDNPALRFIISDDIDKTLARLMLAKAVSIVIASGLKIFNVTPIDKM